MWLLVFQISFKFIQLFSIRRIIFFDSDVEYLDSLRLFPSDEQIFEKYGQKIHFFKMLMDQNT